MGKMEQEAARFVKATPGWKSLGESQSRFTREEWVALFAKAKREGISAAQIEAIKLDAERAKRKLQVATLAGAMGRAESADGTVTVAFAIIKTVDTSGAKKYIAKVHREIGSESNADKSDRAKNLIRECFDVLRGLYPVNAARYMIPLLRDKVRESPDQFRMVGQRQMQKLIADVDKEKNYARRSQRK